MRERIKQIRKEFGMTQQEFADRLKVPRNTIAGYEVGKSNPSDAAINNICRELGVNESWLRTGNGDMFLPKNNDILNTLIREYNLTDYDRTLLEKYLKMNPRNRELVMDYIFRIASTFAEPDLSDFPDSPEELEDQFPPLGSEADGKVG